MPIASLCDSSASAVRFPGRRCSPGKGVGVLADGLAHVATRPAAATLPSREDACSAVKNTPWLAYSTRPRFSGASPGEMT